MRREYDVFERFADGSSIWRATVAGRFEAERKVQELAEHSANSFFVIDMHASQQPPLAMPQRAPRVMAKIAVAS